MNARNLCIFSSDGVFGNHTTMKCIINNQVVLSRAPEGPLAAQIGSFAESVNKQGYR